MNGFIQTTENTINEIINYPWRAQQNKPHKLTSIVMLTYNQLDYTKLCIESIRKFTHKDSYEIIIVDNNSQDGTQNWLKQQNDLTVIYNKENKGFPAGCNQGIKVAKGESILLLNNDIIVTPNWLYNLNNALWSDDKIGAVGSVTNNISYYQAIYVNYNNVTDMLNYAKNNNNSNHDMWKYRVKLVGFCMLIKKAVIDEVGVLDEIFTPGNYEDDDLSYRIIKSGKQNIFCNDAYIHHFGSVSFKSTGNQFSSVLTENKKKFTNKWNFNPNYSSNIRFDIIDKIQETQANKALNVLEIGCGTGATLLEVKSRYKNANLFGIEICEDPAFIAQHSVNILIDDIESMQLPYNKCYFDYIIMGDVLEHLKDPWAALKKIKPHLKPSGIIIASIPNIMHISIVEDLLKGHFTYQDAGILDKTHLRFFTAHEIVKMFIDCDYEKTKISTNQTGVTQSQQELIKILCNLYGSKIEPQYKAYQYLITAKANNHYTSTQDYTDLRYSLMQIDNNIELENNADKILTIYNTYKELLIDDIKAILQNSIINIELTLNFLAVNILEKNHIEFSLDLLMYAYELNPNNKDTVYNLSSALGYINEIQAAFNIISKYTDSNSTDNEIINLKNQLFEKL